MNDMAAYDVERDAEVSQLLWTIDRLRTVSSEAHWQCIEPLLRKRLDFPGEQVYPDDRSES